MNYPIYPEDIFATLNNLDDILAQNNETEDKWQGCLLLASELLGISIDEIILKREEI